MCVWGGQYVARLSISNVAGIIIIYYIWSSQGIVEFGTAVSHLNLMQEIHFNLLWDKASLYIIEVCTVRLCSRRNQGRLVDNLYFVVPS